MPLASKQAVVSLPIIQIADEINILLPDIGFGISVLVEKVYRPVECRVCPQDRDVDATQISCPAFQF